MSNLQFTSISFDFPFPIIPIDLIPGYQKLSWSKVVMDWKTFVSIYFVWRFLRYERLAYKHLFLCHRASFMKHTNTICKALLQSVEKIENKIVSDSDIQKMIDTNASTIIWKSMTPFDQDNFWYPGIIV
jgi:hypothetical protein